MNDNGEANIRRIENGNWYWIEKGVIQHYAPIVGVLGIAVYNYLASLADAKQSCFPSQQRIGEVLGYSRTTINKVMRRLEENGLILVDRSSRYQHTYRLLRVRCKPGETQMLNTGRRGVKPAHTINNISRYITKTYGERFQVIHRDEPGYGGRQEVKPSGHS